MSNDTKEKVLNELNDLFDQTDISINEWMAQPPPAGSTSKGNLQFPVLLAMMAVRLNWSGDQMRASDPFVRKYIRSNPDWFVTRGAGGGIMKSTEKQKKDGDKLAKDLAKQKMKEAIEAKAAELKAASAITPAVTTEPEDTEEPSEPDDSDCLF